MPLLLLLLPLPLLVRPPLDLHQRLLLDDGDDPAVGADAEGDEVGDVGEEDVDEEHADLDADDFEPAAEAESVS